MSVRWLAESVRRGRDPSSGSELVQLTSSPVISDCIYGEQPPCTPDGVRIAFLRYLHSGDPNRELWVCDLEAMRVARVGGPVLSVGCRAYSGFVYYETVKRGRRVLVELSLETLEAEEVFDTSGLPRFMVLGTVSPDGRYYVGMARLGLRRYALIRLDLRGGEWRVIHERPDLINPHPQFEPGRGLDVLVQWNRGGLLDEAGNIVRLVGEEGATLYVIDRDGGSMRQLPVGRPYTAPITGHECWVGRTGEVVLTIGLPWREAVERGNVLAVRPGEASARVVSKGPPVCHISASRDGRFFIGDELSSPGKPIVVGSMRTGRRAVLCRTMTSAGSAQYTHPHPYMTADNGWVIFNSDRTGVPQLYAASVPDRFLESLEG
ncbi:MAG: hypothetical protein DRJ56_00725 [Thermoprotei archaeon]|nr:MAG: hypothetical protein DRJ56_00725 [Thermoprotei archaeon]